MTEETLHQLKKDGLCDMSIIDKQEYETNVDNKNDNVIKCEDRFQDTIYKKYELEDYSIEELLLHYQIRAYNCLQVIENILFFFLGVFIVGIVIMFRNLLY